MMKIDIKVNNCKGEMAPEYVWLSWRNLVLMGGKVRPHGEKWIPGEVSNYQKQKETIIELDLSFPMVLMVR